VPCLGLSARFFAPRKKTHPPGCRQVMPARTWRILPGWPVGWSSLAHLARLACRAVESCASCELLVPSPGRQAEKHRVFRQWAIMVVRLVCQANLSWNLAILRRSWPRFSLIPCASRACLTRAHQSRHGVVLCNHRDPARFSNP
jgi:hypothetical protein